jgi:hypothetical protein
MGRVLGEDKAEQEPALRPFPPGRAHASQGKGKFTPVFISFLGKKKICEKGSLPLSSLVFWGKKKIC